MRRRAAVHPTHLSAWSGCGTRGRTAATTCRAGAGRWSSPRRPSRPTSSHHRWRTVVGRRPPWSRSTPIGTTWPWSTSPVDRSDTSKEPGQRSGWRCAQGRRGMVQLSAASYGFSETNLAMVVWNTVDWSRFDAVAVNPTLPGWRYFVACDDAEARTVRMWSDAPWRALLRRRRTGDTRSGRRLRAPGW